MLEYLGRDPETRVVAMLLESISDGRRLFEAAAAVTPQKPVVVLKTGRHPDAQRAAASHTAALSGDAAVAFAALRQAGVHVVEDGLALLDVAASLDRQPPLRGRNIGIITNSGGTGVELTDLLEAKGLAVPALSPELQAAIGSVPAAAGIARQSHRCHDRLVALRRHVRGLGRRSDEFGRSGRGCARPVAALGADAGGRRRHHRGAQRGRASGARTNPIHVCWVAPRSADANREKFLRPGYPAIPGPPPPPAVLAATALEARRDPGRRSRPRDPFLFPLRSTMRAGWRQRRRSLCCSRRVSRWRASRLVPDAGEAATMAEEMQFPVVLKAERPGLVHKSDAGAVRLGLRNGAAVVEAFEDFQRRLGPGPALLQQPSETGRRVGHRGSSRSVCLGQSSWRALAACGSKP